MEASVWVAEGQIEDEAPSPEMLKWWAEVVADLPAGDSLTDSELRVDYLLEKVLEEEKRLAHVREFTQRRIDMVVEHGDREMHKIANRIRHLHSRIAAHLPPSAAGFKDLYGKKSVSLPHGEIGFRSSGESMVIRDDAAALAFAKANGIPVKVKEEVQKKPLTDYFRSTGEVPEGCEVVPGKDALFIRPKGEEL